MKKTLQVRPGYVVMAHLTHRHDGTSKNAMKCRILSITHETAYVQINKLKKNLYIPLAGIVHVCKKETFGNMKEALAKKYSK
jgi:hypothetical protein